MIIQKYDDYFLIKVFKDSVGDFNIFDLNSIKDFFQVIFEKLKINYDLNGLIDVDVFVNDNYGIIIEMKPICDYFEEIEMKIKMHLSNVFLVEIDSNSILDYNEVYYYEGKFYGTYLDVCDSEVLYKNTDEIINKGIRIC